MNSSNKHLSKELKLNFQDSPYFKLASSESYIYSSINMSIRFEFFISIDSIGLKYPKGNLSKEKINAITLLLNEISIGEFTHRTYGSNKTAWSVWELDVTGKSEKEIIDIVKFIRNGVL